ncbi:ATP-binding protein [Planctomycetota bacterium]
MRTDRDDKALYPMSKVSPEDTKTELNCRSVRPILFYLEEGYGRERMCDFVYGTKMHLPYLENENNWVSYDYWCRLLARLVEFTGDARSPFAAGTYASRRGCFGTLQTFFSRLGTPGDVYRLGVLFASRYGKMGTLKIGEKKRDRCTIEVRYHDAFSQDRNNCLNLQGVFSSIPSLWGLPFARVKELQCVADGAESCIHQFVWKNRASRRYGMLGVLAGAGVCLVLWVLGLSGTPLLLAATMPLMGYLGGRITDYQRALRESIEVNEKGNSDLLGSIETIEKLNADLQTKVERRTEELDESNRDLQKAMRELKESQEMLIQSEKMASVGRLAAGMAHELNNPVGAIRSYIQDVLEDTTDGDSRRHRLMKAERTTGRCGRILSDLLTFSRESRDLKLVNVNDVLREVVSNEREDAGASEVEIIKELDPDLPEIMGDPLQVRQVFTNILVNAFHAVSGSGRITVRTSRTPGRVAVQISDNGEGVSEKIRDKIFDPFFTTKGPDKGSGLGLALSYNIVQRFNGDMRVESREGEGATFTVELPIGLEES